jgi:hypothetical protein
MSSSFLFLLSGLQGGIADQHWDITAISQILMLPNNQIMAIALLNRPYREIVQSGDIEMSVGIPGVVQIKYFIQNRPI